MILEILLSSAISLGTLTENICRMMLATESDPATIEACTLVSDKGFENASDVRELYLKVPMTDAELDSLCRTQCPDGSWPDIDYTDKNRGSWQPSLHAFRICRMAIRYRSCGDKKALESALLAIRFWIKAGIVCSNWWHNEIGIPRLMGPAFILLKDEMDAATKEGAVAVMAASGFRQTGQNRIWQAGNVLLRALLQDDAALVSEARDVLISEMRLCPGEEGLQPDWSFHQHGPQLQFGNYGMSYAVTMSWWARALSGTGLDFPEEKFGYLQSYVSKGLGLTLWNGWFDHNACGRQVFPNAQIGKALCVKVAASNLGLDLEVAPGGHYYPCSDYGIYVGKGWYASLRMQSLRTKGFENTNSENMKGYFTADGALLVRVEGDEYNNIAPIWEAHHIPGVTAWDDGTPVWGNRNGPGHTPGEDEGPYNRASLVAGKTDGSCMAVAMDYDRDTLTCRKAYFFFEGGVVCLGAGISKPGRSRVTTTVEQNILKGEVRTGRRWATHRGISYLLLSDSDYTAGPSSHTGKWSWICPAFPDTDVRGDVFEMVLDHGVAPQGASYAYAVLPGVELNNRSARRQDIKVLSNTTSLQSVLAGGRKMEISWDPFEIRIF